MMQGLYVVTAVFNPRRFESRARLYRHFAKYVVDSGARLITVELAFGDRPFELTESNNRDHVQLRTGAELWHKERLLNLGIQRIIQNDPAARYIAWVDADVTFARPDWAAETVHALQHHCVVQMFGNAVHLGPHHEVLWHCPSAFRRFHDKGYHRRPPLPWQYWGGGHPGLAWAARRQTLDQLGGLIDFCVAGSGDTHMANALMGQPRGGVFNNDENRTLKGFSPAFVAAVERWGGRCEQHVRGDVGYLPGSCLHHWHGKTEQRGYLKRWDIVRYHQFDPALDLVADASGLWRWSGRNPRLAEDIRRSLSTRNEDSIDP